MGGRWISCVACEEPNNIGLHQDWLVCRDCGHHHTLEVPDEPEPEEFPEPSPIELWGEP